MIDNLLLIRTILLYLSEVVSYALSETCLEFHNGISVGLDELIHQLSQFPKLTVHV